MESLNAADAARWCEIVLADWRQLEHAPAECKGDPELVCEATRLSAGEALRFAGEALRGDQEFVIGAAEEIGTAVLSFASPSLRGDHAFALEVCQRCPPSEVLQCVLPELRTALLGDRTFLLAAVQERGIEALQDASSALRDDRDFVLLLIEHLPPEEVLEQFASESLAAQLAADRLVVLRLLGRCGAVVLKGSPEALRADTDFMLKALRAGGPLVLEHAARQLRQSPAFLQKAAREIGAEAPAVLSSLQALDGAVTAADYWIDEGGGHGYWDVEGIVSDYQLACRDEGSLTLLDMSPVDAGSRGGPSAFVLVQQCSRVA